MRKRISKELAEQIFRVVLHYKRDWKSLTPTEQADVVAKLDSMIGPGPQEIGPPPDPSGNPPPPPK